MKTARYRLVLAKEDFKFSAAHFTLFGAGRAELLHGHNYRVALELYGATLDEWGLLIDLDTVKRAVRTLCARLDSRTLVPAESPVVTCSQEARSVVMVFGERRYVFPADDVLALPLANTSIELFARYFWEQLAPGLAGSRIEGLAVSVEETSGQRCVYDALLPASSPR